MTSTYLYVQDLLLLKQKRVVDTKLRFCLSAGSVNVISSSYNNIRPLGNKLVFLDAQLEIITAAEKENVIIAEKFNIDLLLTKSFFFFYLNHFLSKPFFEIRCEGG